jgi:hypothetical protein
LPELASNRDSPNLYLQSSNDYSSEPLHPALLIFLSKKYLLQQQDSNMKEKNKTK